MKYYQLIITGLVSDLIQETGHIAWRLPPQAIVNDICVWGSRATARCSSCIVRGLHLLR